MTDPFDGFLSEHRHLIHDRDPLFTVAFDRLMKDAAVEPVRLPPRSPDLNAYAERFVLAIKSECLDRLVIFGERHLRHVIDEYMDHYHLDRPHQGLGNRPLSGSTTSPGGIGVVRRSDRLGGLLKSYHREAA